MTDTPNQSQPLLYQIDIQGHLDEGWADWFGEVSITLLKDGTTRLTCQVVDQAALHGLLRQIRDLNLLLISVNRIDPGSADRPDDRS